MDRPLAHAQSVPVTLASLGLGGVRCRPNSDTLHVLILPVCTVSRAAIRRPHHCTVTAADADPAGFVHNHIGNNRDGMHPDPVK